MCYLWNPLHNIARIPVNFASEWSIGFGIWMWCYIGLNEIDMDKILFYLQHNLQLCHQLLRMLKMSYHRPRSHFSIPTKYFFLQMSSVKTGHILNTENMWNLHKKIRLIKVIINVLRWRLIVAGYWMMINLNSSQL